MNQAKGKTCERPPGKEPALDWQQTHYGGVDLLRHFLALEVVVAHAVSSSRYSPRCNELLHDFGRYNGAVLGFFIVSGFFSKVLFIPAGQESKHFLAAQAKKLLLPFLVFSLLDAGVMALLGRQSLAKGLFETLCLKGSSMQLYFLPLLFGITAAFLLIRKFLLGAEMMRQFGLPALVLALLLVANSWPTNFVTGNDSRLFPLYLASYGGGLWLATAWRSRSQGFFKAATASFALLFLWGFHDYRMALLSLTGCLFLLALKCSQSAPLNSRQFPGSGGVYLLHVPFVLYAFSEAMQAFGMRDLANVGSSVLLTYLACLAATLAFRTRFKSWAFLLLN